MFEEFLSYPFQKFFKSFPFDVLKVLSIDSRRSIVGLCQSIGFSQNFLLADMTIQSPKTSIACRSSPWCISFSSVPANLWKPLSFPRLSPSRAGFPASPPKKDLRYSRAPSLRQGYAVLAISATTDSSATLSPVCPLRLSTYKAYLAPVVSSRDEEGFPSW